MSRRRQVILAQYIELVRQYPQSIPVEVVSEIVRTAHETDNQPSTKGFIQASKNNTNITSAG